MVSKRCPRQSQQLSRVCPALHDNDCPVGNLFRMTGQLIRVFVRVCVLYMIIPACLDSAESFTRIEITLQIYYYWLICRYFLGFRMHYAGARNGRGFDSSWLQLISICVFIGDTEGQQSFLSNTVKIKVYTNVFHEEGHQLSLKCHLLVSFIYCTVLEYWFF